MTWMKPWMVGGGVAHEVEVARLLAFASSGGAEGIVTPGDLKVRPLSTPGGKIRVAPGAALMLNRFPGGTGQTYVGRLPAQEEVTVTATGSAGGRTDLVVARIYDHQYAGPVPPNVQDFDYARTEVIESVPAGTVSARDLNLSYPAVALARIDLPNNTGTVQASHITDVREIAQPRKERHLIAHNLVTGEGDSQLTDSTSQAWPHPANLGNPDQWFIRVPEWAQRVRLVGMWAGVYIRNSSAQNTFGRIWVQIATHTDPDTVTSQTTSWDTSNYGDNVREMWMAADNQVIPEGMRGRTVRFYLMGRVLGGSGVSLPLLNATSAVTLDVEFYETAV